MIFCSLLQEAVALAAADDNAGNAADADAANDPLSESPASAFTFPLDPPVALGDVLDEVALAALCTADNCGPAIFFRATV